MVTRRSFLSWLAALPALLVVKPSAPKPAAPAFTGGFGPLNPPKPDARSFWSPDPDYAVGVDMGSGSDFTVADVSPPDGLYVAEVHPHGENVTLGEDDIYAERTDGRGFTVWRYRGA